MKLVSSPLLLLFGVLACAALVPAAEAQVRFLPLYIHLNSVDFLVFRCSGLTQGAGTTSPRSCHARCLSSSSG
jgi:hypothetical protein